MLNDGDIIMTDVCLGKIHPIHDFTFTDLHIVKNQRLENSLTPVIQQSINVMANYNLSKNKCQNDDRVRRWCQPSDWQPAVIPRQMFQHLTFYSVDCLNTNDKRPWRIVLRRGRRWSQFSDRDIFWQKLSGDITHKSGEMSQNCRHIKVLW